MAAEIWEDVRVLGPVVAVLWVLTVGLALVRPQRYVNSLLLAVGADPGVHSRVRDPGLSHLGAHRLRAVHQPGAVRAFLSAARANKEEERTCCASSI